MSLKRHGENFFQAMFVAVLVLIFTSSALGLQSTPETPLAEAILELYKEASENLSQNIPNKQEFIDMFSIFKQSTEDELVPELDQMGTIIKNYADNQDGLKASSDQLIVDFEMLSSDLDSLLVQYPLFAEVEAIIQPQINEFEQLLMDGFPEVGPPTLDGNPFGKFSRFYKETEGSNPFGLSPFFRVEINPNMRARFLTESINELTIMGFKQDRILFREISEFSDDVLVFHKVVKNDKIAEKFIALDDLSLYHGLPDQMRADGVDEILVQFVEEHIKLLNFHLLGAFNQKGLIVDVDNPQIMLPSGYTPADFVQNLVQIIMTFGQANPASQVAVSTFPLG